LEHYQIAVLILLALAACAFLAAAMDVEKEDRGFLAVLSVMTLVAVSLHAVRMFL